MFDTIRENVQSFFGKERELEHPPNPVPKAASEVFEHPQPTKIVDKPLPNEKPGLPFSPEQLRHALEKQQEKQHEQEAPKENPDAHDLDEFETVLHTIEAPAAPAPETPKTPQEPERDTPEASLDGGYFDEFHQFLLKEGYTADGVREMDIVGRMREFHEHQKQGKEYYVYSKDVRQAIDRKLNDLKTLEREWFSAKREIDDLERGVRSIELKSLLQQAQNKTKLEEKVPPGQEFILKDGRKLSSLLDLKSALRTMTPEVFRHHVTHGRNDFADWVQATMKNRELADRLARTSDPHELAVCIEESVE